MKLSLLNEFLKVWLFVYNFSGHKVDTYENLKIIFFPAIFFADKINSRGLTETENKINSAVRLSDALFFINNLKDYLIRFSFDKYDSLNYLFRYPKAFFSFHDL